MNIGLAPVALQTQADYDRFEEKFLNRLPIKQRAAIYEAMWQGHLRRLKLDPKQPERIRAGIKAAIAAGEGRGILRLTQRLALLHLKSFRQTGSSRRIIELAELMRAIAPDDAESKFVLSYARSAFLTSGSADNTYQLSDKNRGVAEKLLSDWKSLLKNAPEFQGPFGWDANKIRKEIKALTYALNPEKRASSKRGPLAAKADPINALMARRDLWQHERGHAGTRRNLCDARKLSLKATGGTEIEYMADLVCAITLAKIDVGLARLQSLLGAPSLGEACKWVGKLQATSPKPLFEIGGAASLAKQLKKLGLPSCRELLPPS